MDDDLLSRIEDSSLNASAPPQQRWMDGWLVRYSPGKARRARCVNAVAPGRLPLARKLSLARTVFSEAGLPLVIRITRFTQPASLDSELGELGWPRLDTTRVQVKADLRPDPLTPLPPGMTWAPLDAAAYAEAVGALRESPAVHRQAHAERLRWSPVPYQGFAICSEASGAVLACGQFAREGDLVGLYDVFTHPEYRGKGLAGILCERLLKLAANEGATTAYLQVEAGNDPALKVYARLGFVDGYTYHYREAPPG